MFSAQVALLRVRTLEGVHLTSFDPCSIKVSNNCLEEVNRLRKVYRSDLDAYAIPTNKSNRKRRLNLEVHAIQFLKRLKSEVLKEQKLSMLINAPRKLVFIKTQLLTKARRKCVTMMTTMTVKFWVFAVRWITHVRDGHKGDITNAMNNGNKLQSICAQMSNLNFIKPLQCSPGGPDIVLTRPDVT